jgi:hypothetical protein
MALGPGKYDKLASDAREKAEAVGVVLIVYEGSKGSGFSVQMPREPMRTLPAVLRQLADDIERDLPRDLADA